MSILCHFFAIIFFVDQNIIVEIRDFHMDFHTTIYAISFTRRGDDAPLRPFRQLKRHDTDLLKIA